MNSENKKWFDMMCEWKAKVYKANPGCEEKIQCLLDGCHVSDYDFKEYDDTKDYRAMLLSIYFMAGILGSYGDRDREFIPIGDDDFGGIAFTIREILVLNDCEESRVAFKNPEDYEKARNKFNIKYPLKLYAYPFHFEAYYPEYHPHDDFER